MKEQSLISNDEVILRDVYPVLVSNKRIYIVKGFKKSFKSLNKRKIIQIDQVSAVRSVYRKNGSFLSSAILFFVLALVAGGLLGYLYISKNSLFDTLKLPGIIACSALLFLFFLFIILYASIRTKVLWIEYPNSYLNKPTKVAFRHVSKHEFRSLVQSIFVAMDRSKKAPTESIFDDRKVLL